MYCVTITGYLLTKSNSPKNIKQHTANIATFLQQYPSWTVARPKEDTRDSNLVHEEWWHCFGTLADGKAVRHKCSETAPRHQQLMPQTPALLGPGGNTHNPAIR